VINYKKILILLALYLPQTGYAETVAAPLPAALTVELPNTLLGSDCRKTSVLGSDIGKIVICLSKNFIKDGLVGVTVVPESQATYDELVKQMRDSFHESGSLKVVSEDKFTPVTVPDAVGLRAEYATGSGRKFTWSVSHQGVFTRVLVTVFGKTNIEDVEPEILAKIFGPDRYPASASSVIVKPVEIQ
jgi:hypothetical protein